MTPRAREPRRTALAWSVGLSLAVHGGLVLFLVRLAPPVRVRVPPAPPLRVTVLRLPPRPARGPTPGPVPAPPPDRPRPDARPRPTVPPATAQGTPSSAPSVARASPPADAAPAPAPGAPAPASRGPTRSEAPLALFPDAAVARGAGAPAAPDPGPGVGRTGPDGPASRAEEGRIVQQRVQTWRLQSMGERQVAVGVDDYFRTYRHALEDGLGVPPPDPGPKHGDLSAGQRFMSAWLDALAEADPAKSPARHEGERLPDMTGVQDVSGHVDETLRNHLGANAVQPSFVGNRLVRRALPSAPVAVLRIVQRADGHVAGSELVASSGDRTFDAWVLEHAALALGSMPPPPARSGAGLHLDGTRTEWAFWRENGRCSVLLLRAY